MEAVYRDTHREVDLEVYREVNQDSTEATSGEHTHDDAYRGRTHEVDQMVTEADFERSLPNEDESTSQCRVLMMTGCKIYSTEHAEALHRAQMPLARLNLVSITILEKLTC
jgi:hypothetical protein